MRGLMWQVGLSDKFIWVDYKINKMPSCTDWLQPAFRVLKESDGNLGNNICSLPEVCALCNVGLGQKIVNQSSPNIIAPDEMRNKANM